MSHVTCHSCECEDLFDRRRETHPKAGALTSRTKTRERWEREELEESRSDHVMFTTPIILLSIASNDGAHMLDEPQDATELIILEPTTGKQWLLGPILVDFKLGALGACQHWSSATMPLQKPPSHASHSRHATTAMMERSDIFLLQAYKSLEVYNYFDPVSALPVGSADCGASTETAGTTDASAKADDGEPSMDLGLRNVRRSLGGATRDNDEQEPHGPEGPWQMKIKNRRYTGKLQSSSLSRKRGLSQWACTLGKTGGKEIATRLPWVSIKHSIRTNYVAILKSNYVFWPAAEIVITQLAEVNHRPLWGAVASLFWNAYLSWKTNREFGPQRRQPTPAEKHRVE
ncbi:hypothetical protein HPB47_020420 [Ixodes persulcatus]|uniref:Uncharacterized protein n=2 Tax=Ixodes persulcatus TaxID=34615 RepID=A0AC60QFF4_IXOPE|nr:hypothetical protein HPB47_020420 [Ixodes persulcatus]